MSYQTNFNSPLNVERLAQIEAILRERPASMRQLVDLVSLPSGTISTLMKHLRGKVHVAGWQTGERLCVAMWSWGDSGDIPRPPKYKRPSRKKQIDSAPELEAVRSKDEQAALVARARTFKPQPVRRGWDAVMLFGEAA